jgi:hypothetical protein
MGVYVAVYVLTFVCYGSTCLAPGPERVVAESPAACEMLKVALLKLPTPDRLYSAECVGEMRQYDPRTGWAR